MKARERFDKILLSCRDRIQEEVSALIGKPFKLGEPKFGQLSKEEVFSESGGKQVLAHVHLEGDVQGEGCLLTGIKAAIYIGGTLIMLPESELESVLADQEYSDELQDSYGEVANIICGAATVTFEEQYPKNVRLVRAEQEIVNPVKVVVEAEQPIADVPYYCMTVPVQLDSRELGTLQMILPAVPFGLVEEAVTEKVEQRSSEASAATGKRGGKAVEEPLGEIVPEASGDAAIPSQDGVLQRSGTQEEATVSNPSEKPAPRKRDLSKQKKLIDDLLNDGTVKVCEEVSALLGGTLKVMPIDNMVLTKEGFLGQAGGKQIMTRMDIRGEQQGEAYLFVDVKTAVYLGGVLIMLPEGELEETVRNEEFGDDARDAYGEVTNIIAGVYTSIFEERYHSKLGLVKTSMEPVTPVKIDPDTDDVFVNQPYYLSLGQIQYNGRDLGRLQLVLPARVLELEELLLVSDEPEAISETKEQALVRPGKPIAPAPAEADRIRGGQAESANILLFTDDDGEASRIAEVLQEMGYGCRILHFKDQVNSVLTPRIQMVFLVMRETSEQGFGVAIKISSAGLPIPLVAAGPAWTRTLVLKAVKYGACDILITPSSADDVREKIEINLVKKAA
jgi:chemotaxis protein CheY-P-specific phosphatase CheC